MPIRSAPRNLVFMDHAVRVWVDRRRSGVMTRGAAAGERIALTRRHQENTVTLNSTATARGSLAGLEITRLSPTVWPLIFSHRARVRLVGLEILSRCSVHEYHLRSA
jgi:hypothetical protein